MKQIVFYFLSAIFIGLFSFSTSQAGVLNPRFSLGTPPPDTLVYTDGTKKVVSMLRITNDEIAYKEQNSEVERKILPTDIQMIKYADGGIKSFENQADTTIVAKIIEPIGKKAFNNRMLLVVLSVVYSLISLVIQFAPVVSILVSLAFLVANIACYVGAVKSLRLYRKYPNKYIGKGYPITVVVLFALGIFSSILLIGILLLANGMIASLTIPFFIALVATILSLIPAFGGEKEGGK